MLAKGIACILIAGAIQANAQNQQDTLVGKTLVARLTFKSYKFFGTVNSKAVFYEINDVNTSQPVVVKEGSQWKCEKLEHSYYLLTDSGVTIKVTKKISDGFCGYWVELTEFGPDKGVLSISGFVDKRIWLAGARRDSVAKVRLDSSNEATEEKRLKVLEDAFGENDGIEIYNGKIEIGFTKDMCEAAWGNPDYDLSTEVTDAYGITYTVLVYTNRGPAYTSLHFKNGILFDVVIFR